MINKSKILSMINKYDLEKKGKRLWLWTLTVIGNLDVIKVRYKSFEGDMNSGSQQLFFREISLKKIPKYAYSKRKKKTCLLAYMKKVKK